MSPATINTSLDTHHHLWIDVLKGIAILLVVVGHNSANSSFIECFHMPLFFMLSGWLFSPKQPADYLKKSIDRLLVPYFFWLALVAFPQILMLIDTNRGGSIGHLMLTLCYGGVMLKGAYAVFWFITVLWMSTNLFNLIIAKRVNHYFIALLIPAAYLFYFVPRPLPWNIHLVPMAVAYIWIGFLLKKKEVELKKYVDKSHSMVFLVSTGVLALIFVFKNNLTFSMKYAQIGIPVLSLVASVCASISMAFLAILVSMQPMAAKALSFIGAASMAIMYIHMPVKFYITMRYFAADTYIVHSVCGIGIALVAYKLLRRHNFCRRFLLGETSNYIS